jgi:hypothetical protein
VAAIILPGRWTRQPQRPVAVDRGNSITRSLRFLYTPTMGAELISNSPPVRYANLPLAGRRSGLGVKLSGASNSERFGWALAEPSAACTLAVLLSDESAGTNIESVFGKGGTNTAAGGIGIRYSASNIRAIAYDSTQRSAVGSARSAKPSLVACTHDGTTLRLFENGKETGNIGCGARANTSFQWNLGATQGSADASVAGVYCLAAAWDRVLSPAEMQVLNANPWQLFAPIKRRLYSVPSAAFKAAWARGSNTLIQPRL